MPWGAVAGGIASAVVGSALAPSGGGGGSSGSGAPPAYIPKDQAGADQNFLDQKNNYQNQINAANNATSGYNTQLLNAQFNNPYNAATQAAADQAASWQNLNAASANGGAQSAWNYANQQVGNAQQLQGLYQQGLSNVQNSSGQLYAQANQSNQTYNDLIKYQQGQQPQIQQSQNNLYGAGNQVLQTSQDPQNALYNRTAGQLTDQTRAAEYARGIQSSPYGASVESNALGNFNIDWQNQQLARQSQGLQAAQGAYGSAQGMGNSYTSNVAGLQAGQNEQYAGLTNAAQSQYTNYLGAMNQNNLSNTQNIAGAQNNAYNLGQQGVQSLYNAGQLGQSAYQQNLGYQQQGIQNYNANNQPYLQGLNQLQSNDLSYMNYGQGAQNQAFNQNAYNNQQTQNAVSSIAGPIGNAVKNQNWSSLFGGGSGDTSWNTGVNGYGNYDYFG